MLDWNDLEDHEQETEDPSLELLWRQVRIAMMSPDRLSCFLCQICNNNMPGDCQLSSEIPPRR